MPVFRRHGTAAGQAEPAYSATPAHYTSARQQGCNDDFQEIGPYLPFYFFSPKTRWLASLDYGESQPVRLLRLRYSI